jgi:hypothetical protein
MWILQIPPGTPFRAMLTLPPTFTFSTSGIPGRGVGVFTNTFIQANTWLAEYEGEYVPMELADDRQTYDYAWRVCWIILFPVTIRILKCLICLAVFSHVYFVASSSQTFAELLSLWLFFSFHNYVSVLYVEICSPLGQVGRQLNATLVPNFYNFVFHIIFIFVLHRKAFASLKLEIKFWVL